MTSRRNDLHHLLIAWIGVIPLLIRGNIANCSDALGLSTNKIADDSISATTWQPGRSDPWYGRLNNQSRRSWCAAVVDDMQYLQIDLGPKLRLITAVASQGSHNYDEWVTSYKLSYSTDGGKWKFFGKGNIPEIFDANKNRGTGVKHQINPPIVAAALRFYPVTWEGDMCMRVEAFGCDDIVRSDLGYATPTETIGDNHKSLVANYVSTAYSEALGVENSSVIQDKYLTASHHKYAYDARKGRLYNLENAWSAYPRAGNFFEISIGRQLSIITAVATQGFKNKYHEAWVISYKLSYSLWGDEWMEYIDDGEVKIFRGNNDPNTVVKNYLRHNITALCVRFWPETYYNRPGLRVELYGSKDVCQNPLGVESGDLSNVQFTASSQSPAESDAWNGRLNKGKAWCAGRNDDKQYLQVDLGRVYTVARVATQGHPVNLQWVIRYEVAYSMDNIFWRKALDESKSKTLSGNTDHNTAKEVQFYKHVTGRFLRFLPVEWNEAICMRVEVYGCEECAHPVGIERGVVPNQAFSASSWYDVDHEPWLARLYSRDGEGAWCALENDGKQYLQVDLAQIHIITGVATQGKYETSEWAIRFRAWVTNFSLSFTDDHMLWVNYTEDGVSPKVFDGNSQSIQVIRHTLLKRITSRQIRFLPVTWFGWTCMRVEVFGCKTCSSAIGMEDFHWPSESILVSSVNSGHDAAKARLFNTYTWLRGHNDKDSFLQIGNGIDE
ncbi:uncharacterized protein LOC111326286 [Stylophora pistillata]|uniref:uncharacterized protein LOC111326286 n=1 Tax=Stylophora pistillata TaxID=50429 RepID=UPI000C057980|nr:uncharacterized protein LOC111326286 [Stylophora pistillata]